MHNAVQFSSLTDHVVTDWLKKKNLNSPKVQSLLDKALAKVKTKGT